MNSGTTDEPASDTPWLKQTGEIKPGFSPAPSASIRPAAKRPRGLNPTVVESHVPVGESTWNRGLERC